MVRAQRFSTCFFPDEAVLCRRPQERFSRVAMKYVQRYAQRLPGNTFKAPNPTHLVRVPQESESRANIRFVSHENWGFEHRLSETIHSGRIPKW